MKTYNIATVVKVKNGHIWFNRMEEGVNKFAKDTGHNTFLIGPPEADEHLQETVIEETIAQGVDALCVVPFSPQALEMSLGKARRKGIVVISHEASRLRNVDYDIEPFDNVIYGQHLMDHLARCMGAKGEYAVMMASLTTQSHTEWARAACERQRERYPEMIQISKKIQAHESEVIARQKTEDILQRYPEIQGFLGISMTATVGIGAAIEQKGLGKDISVVGTGLVSGCKSQLLSGATDLISFWDPADAGYALNTLAVMVLEGHSIADGVDLGPSGYHKMILSGKVLSGSAMLDVTRENLSQYTF